MSAVVITLAAFALAPPDMAAEPTGWWNTDPGDYVEVDVAIKVIDQHGDPVVGIPVALAMKKSFWVDDTDGEGVATGRVNVSPTDDSRLAVHLGGETQTTRWSVPDQQMLRANLIRVMRTNAVRETYTFDVAAAPVSETIQLGPAAIVSGQFVSVRGPRLVVVPGYLSAVVTEADGQFAVAVPQGENVELALGLVGSYGFTFVALAGSDTANGMHALEPITEPVREVSRIAANVSNARFAFDPHILKPYGRRVTLIERENADLAYTFQVHERHLFVGEAFGARVGVPEGDYFLCPGPVGSHACARLRAAMKAGLQDAIRTAGVIELSVPQEPDNSLDVDFTPMTSAIYDIVIP